MRSPPNRASAINSFHCPAADPETLLGRNRTDEPAADLTLWGDGRISLRRATPAALELACAPLLTAGQVQDLITFRDAHAAEPRLGALPPVPPKRAPRSTTSPSGARIASRRGSSSTTRARDSPATA